MTEPEERENLPAHDSLFNPAAAQTTPVPGPVAEPEHAPPPPEPLPPAAPEKMVVRRGGTPLLLTLLLTAALGGGIYWAWSHPFPGGIASLSAEPDLSARVQALGERVDRLDKAPAAPAAAADTDTPAKLQALSDRLDKLEKALAPEASGTAPAAADATVELSKKLDDLNAQISGLSARQDALAAGLSKVQDIAAQRPADISTPPVDHSAQELANAGAIQAQQQIADLGGKTNTALTQTKSSLENVQQRLDKLEQAQQADQGTEQAQAQSTAQLSALESRIGKLEQSEGQLQGASKDATLAVRLEAAQAALADGKPLGDLPGAPPALQRFATAAPPTEGALRAQFPDIAAAILAASRPEEAQTGFLSRALARVERSVTVRQGDHVIVGDPAAGVVARARADLDTGDLAGAAAALDALSGRAADAAKTWRDQALALVAARAALLAMAAHG